MEWESGDELSDLKRRAKAAQPMLEMTNKMHHGFFQELKDDGSQDTTRCDPSQPPTLGMNKLVATR